MRNPGLVVTGLMLAGTAAFAQDTGAPKAPPKPEVIIVAPRNGDTTGLTVNVVLQAVGVEVVPASGMREEGKGHHHLFLDVDVALPDSIIPKNAQIVHLGDGSATYQFFVPAGKHRMIAVFAYGNHVPMKGVKPDTVVFIARKK